jgi:hypothetical protein
MKQRVALVTGGGRGMTSAPSEGRALAVAETERQRDLCWWRPSAGSVSKRERAIADFTFT